VAENTIKGKKRFVVDFFFPELKGGAIWQSVVVEDEHMGAALKHAFAEVRKRPGVSKKHISQAKITVAEVSHDSGK
jgi:hypothetical protein